MAKPRKKKRSQPQNGTAPNAGPRVPKSMVIRMGAGQIGGSVTQLAIDYRTMMEPHTASRLRERRVNKLKDYTAMTGPLGVSHLFLFSRSKTGNVHLRIALTPRGPTMTFRVDKYVLAKDVLKVQRRPKAGDKRDHASPPLLVMNNFSAPPPKDQDQDQDTKPDHIKKQLESLTTTIFQSMFPAISPSATPLSSIRRIMLVNREKQPKGTDSTASEPSYIYSLRHYAISTRRTGVSRRLRKFDDHNANLSKPKSKSSLPNLGKLHDASDYLLGNDGGYTSASETELDTDNEIEVLQSQTQQVFGKKQRERAAQSANQTDGDGANDTNTAPKPQQETKGQVEKRAVKLHELGPRLTLHLIKVEEGICEGRVMWNEFVRKSKEEEKELDQKWKVRREVKEERRRKQREDVERKRATKTPRGAKVDGDDGEESEEGWDTDEAELAMEDQDEGMMEIDGEVASEDESGGGEQDDLDIKG